MVVFHDANNRNENWIDALVFPFRSNTLAEPWYVPLVSLDEYGKVNRHSPQYEVLPPKTMFIVALFTIGTLRGLVAVNVTPVM